MKKIIFVFLILSAAAASYFLLPGLLNPGKIVSGDNKSVKLPKVLFMTSGINEGAGYVSEGVLVALEIFGKHGINVRLENRDVLLKPEILSEYSILIMPTSIGYNDGDRNYSLTYLSDYEMDNIKKWVNEGGTLIAEENIGRNTPDGKDRVDSNSELNESNWKLSELFGIKMKEIDMNGFSIESIDNNIWNGTIKEKTEEDEWALIPVEVTSGKVKVLAEWVKDNEKIPAVFSNEFGKGRAFFFSSTYVLHPSNAGGISSIEQIENFYNFVMNSSYSGRKFGYEINPWPNANSTALCLSFKSEGNDEQYTRISNFLTEENIPATFFIDSSVTADQLNLLEQNKNINLQSGFYYKADIGKSDYSELVQGILMNEQKFGKKFTGIKFPFGITNFWGLIFADESGYVYDSSIGVDHLTGYQGTVFPYNIPVSQNTFYRTLNIIEISPTSSSDEDYYEKLFSGSDYPDDDQKNDAMLFSKYLSDFFEFVVSSKNGLMVYSGSPAFTGFSDNTLQPLKKLIDSVKTRNSWITSLDEVAAYRNNLHKLNAEVSESDNGINLKINLPEKTDIKGFTIKLKSKPKEVVSSGSYTLREVNGNFYIIKDLINGDYINIVF